MRDAAEHLDKDILEGRLSETASVGIHLSWNKASLGRFTLAFLAFGAIIAGYVAAVHYQVWRLEKMA